MARHCFMAAGAMLIPTTLQSSATWGIRSKLFDPCFVPDAGSAAVVFSP
jgi:hypothetical protein